jgi:hypothetical protein
MQDRDDPQNTLYHIFQYFPAIRRLRDRDPHERGARDASFKHKKAWVQPVLVPVPVNYTGNTGIIYRYSTGTSTGKMYRYRLQYRVGSAKIHRTRSAIQIKNWVSHSHAVMHALPLLVSTLCPLSSKCSSDSKTKTKQSNFDLFTFLESSQTSLLNTFKKWKF